jgi:outer membrane protein assembly factor BamB
LGALIYAQWQTLNKKGTNTVKLLRRIAIALVVGISLALSTFSLTASAGNWPQWRGPDGSGISNEKNLPSEWSPTKNIKWKTEIDGRAHSSPIVWGNKIFLTTAIEGPVVPGAKAVKHLGDGDKEFLHPDSVGADRKHTFKVICLDRDTGKILWQSTAWEGTPYDNRHRKSSYAASTPATDGKLVYAFFGTEGLYAYDFQGKLAWQAQLGNLATVGMGTGTSPILFDNLVIVQCDEDNGAASFIVAVDKKTGKEVWKTPRKVQVSWSTPLLVRTAKRSELIASGTETVISYDPATGKELWRHKGAVPKQKNKVYSFFHHSFTIHG